MNNKKKKETLAEGKYKAFSYKLICAALVIALIGSAEFIFGIIFRTSIVISCAALTVSAGAIIGNLANYYLEKERKQEDINYDND